MKKLLLLFSAGSLNVFSQGFLLPEVNWTAPNGGKISGNITQGYNSVSGIAAPIDNTGSQSWGLLDMNGDGRQDLVITAQLQAGNVTCFSPGNNQYWKVYLNTGNGFSSSATNWALPLGGKLSGATTFGYNGFSGIATSGENTGSQTWNVADMNGDGKPDLLVTAQHQANEVTCFSPGLNQYWNVFLNTGSGFSNQPTMWALPIGGKLNGGIIYGFDNVSGVASTSHNTGSQTWSLTDIDGDKKPDLIVTAQLQGSYVTSFSPTFNQYWKVYLNTGNGFSGTPTNWTLPNGGKIDASSNAYGYNGIAGSADPSEGTGSRSWALADLSGDSKPELVIPAQVQGGEVTCFSPGLNPYWIVYDNNGTGFSSQNNWSIPIGGKISNAVIYGFNSLGGLAFPSDNTGSQTWAVMDLDGDSKSELVVTAQLQGGNVTSFAPGPNQYWKVYPNSGTGFQSQHFNCPLPNGGKTDGGIAYGFNGISGNALSSDDTGSQTWSVSDLNGDGKPDLIVSGQLQGGNVTSFSPGPGQYWKVYMSDVVVSVNDLAFDSKRLLCYPNPSNGSFILQGSSAEVVQILSATGQMLNTIDLNEGNNFSTTVDDLPSGIYFLKGSATLRVVVFR